MDLGSIDLFNTANKRMKWLAAKQQVISQNVANADTPGYLAKEVEEFDSFLNKSSSMNLKTTHPMHFSNGSLGSIDIRVDDDAWEISPNGNSVVLEQQAIMADETKNDYQLVTKLYKKSLQLLTLASSGGK